MKERSAVKVTLPVHTHACPLDSTDPAGFWSLLHTSADGVQSENDFGGKPQRCSLEVLSKMLGGGCARNQQDVGRALQKPRQRNLHGRGLKRRSCPVQRRRLQWAEASQRKKWHVSNALPRKLIDEAVIVPVRDVVK